jgi:hypothetical protein
MQVDILRIDQSFHLDGSGKVQSYAVLRLSTGELIKAEIDDESIKKLAAAAPSNGTYPTGGVETSVEVANEEVGVASDETVSYEAVETSQVGSDVVANVFSSEGEKIGWAKLSPNVLTPTMKSMFIKLGLPSHLTEQEIDYYVSKILEGMNAEDEKPQQPAIRYAQESTVVRRVPPIHRVQSDERGNPVVPMRSGEVDPGEVVGGGDVDEDGVGSL